MLEIIVPKSIDDFSVNGAKNLFGPIPISLSVNKSERKSVKCKKIENAKA